MSFVLASGRRAFITLFGGAAVAWAAGEVIPRGEPLKDQANPC